MRSEDTHSETLEEDGFDQLLVSVGWGIDTFQFLRQARQLRMVSHKAVDTGVVSRQTS